MRPSRIARRDQEQAIASWVNYLNECRLGALMDKLSAQDANLETALGTIDSAMDAIQTQIIDRDRGSWKGMHGFIAEVAECGVGNAREEIEGRLPSYVWVNDNGPTDLIRDGVQIQQKFSASGGHLSLQAIQQHHAAYPHFIERGGRYQIPSDHYKRVMELYSISPERANKMATSTGEFSLRQWREVQDFFGRGDIRPEDIEPSKLSFSDVQAGSIERAMGAEKASLESRDREIRREAHEASAPSVRQAAGVALVSSVAEGGMTFVTAIIRLRRTGRAIQEFTDDDWKGILGESAVGTIRGGVRGVSVYVLTNFTATPAAVASSLCTAAFGVAEQANLLRAGSITEEQFLANSESLCVECSVSALSSFMGQVLIPVPVLGAVIGNAAGMLLYQIAKDNLARGEAKSISRYLKELSVLDEQLDQRYRDCMRQLDEITRRYYTLLDRAFSPDCSAALESSIALASLVGVPSEIVLKSKEEVDRYFLE